MRIVSLFLVLIFWASCANIVPPGGGKKDTQGPKLLKSLPQDSLLNTRVNKIELHFDEYVNVNDAAKEISITPLLKQNPSVLAYGKKVILKIPDSLLQNNTTYTLQWGAAIRDLHEGNPYSGKAFVFSTGAWFDSLQLRGRIIDAATGLPDSNTKIQVLLYDAQEADSSIVTRKKPLYRVYCNSGAYFNFQGLPDKTFRIFALKEQNENMIWDQDEEAVAFDIKSYRPSKDTLPIALTLFVEAIDSNKKNLKDTLSSSSSGLKKPRMSQTVTSETSTDKAIPPLDTSGFNYVLLVDTSQIQKRTQDITKPLALHFSKTVAHYDTTKLLITRDSNGVSIEEKCIIRWDSTMKLAWLNIDWKQNQVYTIKFYKTFVQDSTTKVNMPSTYSFRTKSSLDYASLKVQLPQNFIGKDYVLQLFKEKKLLQQVAIQQASIEFSLLEPGTYAINVYQDLDQSHSWTSGDLLKQQQPEPVYPYVEGPIRLKAAWENVCDFKTYPIELSEKQKVRLGVAKEK